MNEPNDDDPSAQATGTPDTEALCAIGLDEATRRLAALQPDPTDPLERAPPHLARVVEVQRGSVQVHDGHRSTAARAQPALARRLDDEGDALAVGDWVIARRDAWGQCWIAERLPRRSAVTRRQAHGGREGRDAAQRQVLVANVDTALLVMGLDHDFNPRRLERYLALVRLAGIEAVLVLTKADTVDAARIERCRVEAAAVLPADVAVRVVDARDERAAVQLAPWLQRGRTLVLLGSSGAGKSTLTNTLRSAAATAGAAIDALARPGPQRTGAARADDSRGRHTTTVRSLHPLPGGACVIDTPGLRALRLDAEAPDDLAEAFGDVARWAAQCRFRDCRHQDEPGCAVRAALPEARLRHFHKLLREARLDEQTPLQRREAVAQWKARARAGRERLRAKRDT